MVEADLSSALLATGIGCTDMLRWMIRPRVTTRSASA